MTAPEQTAEEALEAAFRALTACPTPSDEVRVWLANAESHVAASMKALRSAFPHLKV